MGNYFAATSPPVLLDHGTPRLSCIGSGVLPESLSRIVEEYLSDASSNCAKAVLFGVQPITLCLQHHVYAGLASDWYLGLLSPVKQWPSSDFVLDKQIQDDDLDGCLRLLNEKSFPYCPIVIETLVVNFIDTYVVNIFPMTKLRKTLKGLHAKLRSVKHVVISISNCFSCCFSLNDGISALTGLPVFVDPKEKLREIFDDLESCWSANRETFQHNLMEFYFKSDIKPVSEFYLAKIVISNQFGDWRFYRLLRDYAFNVVSNKLMWVHRLLCDDYFSKKKPCMSTICHAIHLDRVDVFLPGLKMNNLLCFRDNPFIERIVFRSNDLCGAVQLPTPSAPLTDATRLSALIELDLHGKNMALHLTQLNNGYFPHLAHLTVIRGKITGHLDSRCVPSLTNLRIELGRTNSNKTRTMAINILTNSLVHAGFPWQLVASQNQGGWSLASYDDLVTNRQEDFKEDSPVPSLSRQPIIRELMLVVNCQKNSDEWQSQLKGYPSLEAAAEDHNDPLLVWAPNCVGAISVFCTANTPVQFDLDQEIPGQMRFSSYLKFHNIDVALHGPAFLHLLSLEVREGSVRLSGFFRSLAWLFLENTSLRSQWQLDAPMLQTFVCHLLRFGDGLSLCPQYLPHLTFLDISPLRDDPKSFPRILLENNDTLGLSRINNVIFNWGGTVSTFFDQYHINNVSQNLYLTLNSRQLPACWFDAEWRCEVLTLEIAPFPTEHVCPPGTPDVVVLPPLPYVKVLTVKENGCFVLLDREMPQLVSCAVTSPILFGSKLKCPALEFIHFTGKLSKGDKRRCLDRATYEAINAQPREIDLVLNKELYNIKWENSYNENKALGLAESLKKDEDSSAPPE